MAGQILATPLAAGIAYAWGWQLVFFIPALMGFAVAMAWWFSDRETAEYHRFPCELKVAASGSEGAMGIYWGVVAARLLTDPLWFFFLFWEPGFLQEKLGMSLGGLARFGWIPTAVATVSLIGLGAVSDRLVRNRKWAPAKSRRVILQWSAALSPAVLALYFVESPALAIVLLCVARIMMVVWLNFTNILVAELVPSNTVGTAVALTNAFGAATGLVCNAIIGPLVHSGGYGMIFGIGALLHPTAAFLLWRCYGRRRPTDVLGR